MAGKNRDRHRSTRQTARAAAEADAGRRAARRRWAAAVGIGALVIGVSVLVVILASSGGDDSTDVATDDGADTSTTVAPTEGSAAGKPCVAVSQPLPPGAPAVPVKTGPPPSDLVTEDLKVGTGPPVTPDATVTVNYVGVSCSTGAIFDSSYATGKPAVFPLNQMIPGWKSGIPGMNVGGQRLLGIPPAQAYGDQGFPPDIAPDETIWFVVEVVDAKAG